MLSGLDLKVSESARDIIKGKGPWGKFWMLSTDESEEDSCGEDDTSSDDGVSTRALSVCVEARTPTNVEEQVTSVKGSSARARRPNSKFIGPQWAV
jgi:hypothetical protein